MPPTKPKPAAPEGEIVRAMSVPAIDLTLQLVESHQICKQLLGEQFDSEILPYRIVLRRLMPLHENRILQAMKAIVEQNVDRDGYVLRVLAATVEEMHAARAGAGKRGSRDRHSRN